jgi:hypothetical protein
VPRGGELRAIGQSAANHLRYGGRNSIGNTKTTLAYSVSPSLSNTYEHLQTRDDLCPAFMPV